MNVEGKASKLKDENLLARLFRMERREIMRRAARLGHPGICDMC